MPGFPVVSVVIPCLDQAHFLHAALRSVAGQTHGPVETIVVNDGSTDETSEVAEGSGAVVLHQPNFGVSAARNAGLRRATAPFVIFLDADDELEPDAVASGVASLDHRPDAWMVARHCVLIDADGHELPTSCQPPDNDDLYGEWLVRNLVWTPGAAIFRREPLLAMGGFPGHVGPAADYAVYLEMARAGRVVFDERTAVRYRQHASNMSRDAGRMLRATLAVLRRERRHLPERYRRKYEEGLHAWRTFYGEQIIQQLRADMRRRRLHRAQLRDVALLLRECSGLALMHVSRKVRRTLAGYPPTPVEPGRFAAQDDPPRDGRESIGQAGANR